MRAAVLAVLLAGCPAEMLGIPTPASGVRALSMDDLTRDTRGLSSPDPQERAAFLEERWRQMGLVPVEGGRCGQRDGATGARVAVVAEALDGSLGAAAHAAVVVSVAKAFHGVATLPRGAWFCTGAAPPAAVQVVTVDVPVSDDPDYRQLLGEATRLVPVVHDLLSGSPTP